MFGKFKNSGRRFHPLKILFFVMIFIVFVAAIGWLVMFLWNAILPDTIGVKPLTYWKAVGLLLLAKILFGGIGGRGRKDRWKNKWESKWKKKWMNMNEEERERFKSKWEERCRSRKGWNERNEGNE